MRRRAVILGCPVTAGQKPLRGVEADLRLHLAHLLSDEGGAWEPAEVDVVVGPTAATAMAAIARAAADFTYVAFSGHGAQPAGQDADGALLCLSDGSEIPTSALFPRSAKSLIIVDACRDIIPDPRFPLMEKRAVHEGFSGIDAAEYRARSRRMYDQFVEAKGDGPVLVAACAAGQNAGDTSRGGAFTLSLILSVEMMKEPGYGLSIEQAVDFAGRYLANELRRPQQTPEYFNGRSKTHFPFAVWPR